MNKQMNSPLKEGNMSLKKLIAIVIHANANLNHALQWDHRQPVM